MSFTCPCGRRVRYTKWDTLIGYIFWAVICEDCRRSTPFYLTKREAKLAWKEKLNETD